MLIRTSTERPEVLDKGSIVVGGITSDSMMQSIEIATKLFSEGEKHDSPYDYKDVNVSSKVVRIIQSYVPIINKVVWDKK